MCELCQTPITEHADVQRLIKQVVELQDRLRWLRSRDCNGKVELCYDDGKNPFAREQLKIVDVGVADNEYVVTSEVVSQLQAENKALLEELRNFRANV